jgi:hypothetical protein
MNSSKDVVFAIVEEIGTDVSYVRLKHGEEGASYFTGIEIGVLFGSAILANFLLGMLKGAVEELTTAGGTRIGKELARKLIGKLTPVAKQAHFKDPDTERLLKLADSHQEQLDSIRKELAAKLPPPEFEALMEANVTYEREQIKVHLERNGFTHEKATLYSERLVRTIQLELKEP